MATEATSTSERPKGLAAATMAEAFQLTAAENADRTALRTKDDEFSITWGGYAERVRDLAAALSAAGIARGDTVGIMLTNRPEFHFADTASIHLGATPFSVYNTSTPEQIAYLLEDAENRVLVTEQAFLDTVLAARDAGSSAVETIVVVDGDARDGAITLDEFEAGGAEDFDLEAAWRAVGPDDLLTLIYTSGTTGPPKGVQLTHANLLATMNSFDQLLRLAPEGRLVSWLPMAHIAERNCTQYLPMTHGLTTTCCPDPRQVVAYLVDVRPSWFFAVPRIWEKLKAAMEIAFDAEPDVARKEAVVRALEVGMKKVRAEQAFGAVPPELALEYAKADEEVLSDLRARIGLDQVEAVNVGAAPTPRQVIEFFHALGIELAELWGMSETSGAGTTNRPGEVKIGTVGPAAPGIELKLADDGEVLLRGPVVMPGYRNDAEKTAETIDAEGWIHTGDVGELDDDGYLTIIDRKKEIIINSAGKNMSPANIEAKLKAASPLIGQACAVGDDRPYNVAMIVLDPDAAPAFAAQEGIEDVSLESLASEPAILEEVAAAVERGNGDLARVEQIKRFKLVPADWQPGGDELTPTMKLKRRPIERKYAAEIEEMYAGR
ncbi:MAG TPA: long-chain fatty acid--CoA ligase [Solirubrobacterales bacterium]|jgi:long-subunit acyl-CoA synthetase (AMP-forming)|nr:long-chain fatty acid--CoA ligase [Solirubrobacterales bacterium]